MEPTKQGGAASSKPAPDLDARFLAMRLGDPSSSQQQARYPAPIPLLLPTELAPTATPSLRPLVHLPPSQPQEFVPTASSVERWPLVNPPQPKPLELVPTKSHDVRLLQQLQVARPYWPQSQPQVLGYGGGESSVGTGCVSPVGASSSGSILASLYGKHSPRFNTPAAPFLSKMPKPSKLSASAEDFHPVPKPNKLSASAEDFQPIPQSHPLMAQSSSTPTSSAGQCLPQLGAAATSSAGHYNASLDPYASALLTAERACQDEYQWRGRTRPIGSLPSLDEVLAGLLCTSSKPASVMSAGAAAAERVVDLLAERGEEVRLRVLDAVKCDVHRIIGCREGHVVFLALLRACEGRFDELHDIVKAALTDVPLMRIAMEVHGEKALKELIRVVAPYPQLCRPLINCLLRQRLMEHCKGAKLLRYCFTTLPYEDCSIIIRYAIATSYKMVSSMVGTNSLVECFEHAKNEELRALELFVLNNTHALAKGEYSNLFLQRVLKCGSNQLQEGIAELVVHDIVGLSEDKFGSFVVETCIHLTCSLVPLLRVLNAFQGLDDDELAQLVQDSYSNYVVQELLKAGKPHFPEQTLALVRRILELPVPGNLPVMRVAKKLFPKLMCQ